MATGYASTSQRPVRTVSATQAGGVKFAISVTSISLGRHVTSTAMGRIIATHMVDAKMTESVNAVSGIVDRPVMSARTRNLDPSVSIVVTGKPLATVKAAVPEAVSANVVAISLLMTVRIALSTRTAKAARKVARQMSLALERGGAKGMEPVNVSKTSMANIVMFALFT